MLKRLKWRWEAFYDDFMHRRYSQPRGRGLYIYDAESARYAIRYMFTAWMAARFPPQWFYEVWSRKPGDGYPDDWIGGVTEGYYLRQADAEESVRLLESQGFRAGWVQHNLYDKIYSASGGVRRTGFAT